MHVGVRSGWGESVEAEQLTLRHTFGYGLSCHKRDDNTFE